MELLGLVRYVGLPDIGSSGSKKDFGFFSGISSSFTVDNTVLFCRMIGDIGFWSSGVTALLDSSWSLSFVEPSIVFAAWKLLYVLEILIFTFLYSFFVAALSCFKISLLHTDDLAFLLKSST
jgi:hypothetical protein